jgi:hypothetical protein
MSHKLLRRSVLLCLAVFPLAGATCLEPPPGDAGPDASSLVCPGQGAQAIDIGHTGVDFSSVSDGADLPVWDRPQGGVGTRINLLITGFGDEQRYDGLTSEVFGAPGASCTGEDDPACIEDEVCDDGSCRLYIANQTNRQFPIDCLEDGTLHISELPLRFRNNFTSDELDNAEVELRVTLTTNDDDPAVVSDSVDIFLRDGDFIQPSWWEDI